jgi:hypothetical protein
MNAEESCLFSHIENNTKVSFTSSLISPITYIYDHTKKTMMFQFSCKFDNKNYKKDNVMPIFVCDITNDPTIERVGGVISLGYFACRFQMENAKVIDEEPFAISTRYRDGLYIRYSRPMRRPRRSMKINFVVQNNYIPEFENNVVYKRQPFMYHFSYDFNYAVTHIFGKNMTDVQHLVVSIEDNGNCMSWVEQILDPLSAYVPVYCEMLYMGNDKKEQQRIHNEAIGKYAHHNS